MVGEEPVWVLLGQRTGDNNHLLRLAEALALPFRAIELRYNTLHLVPPRLLGATLASLNPESRREIRPPWPKLVLGIGYRSVPVALALRDASGGKAKLVRLGNPRLDPGNFDLVITTPQYDVPNAPNVVHLPVGISTAPKLKPTEDEQQWLASLPRPHRMLLIGGDTFMWTLKRQAVALAAAEIAGKGGSVIAVSGPRTAPQVIATVEVAIGAQVVRDFPRYPALLADADEIYVTGDSASMISDAIATGQPVGIIRPTKTVLGRALYALARVGRGGVPIRDIGRFVDSMLEQKLARTVDNPRAGQLEIDPLATAVAATRKLLQD